MELKNGYTKKDKHNFRPMTEEEVLQLGYGDRVWFLANDGSVRQVKVNGRVRTWKKRSPTRNYTIEVPLKYGLYEYDHWRNCGCADDSIERLLVKID